MLTRKLAALFLLAPALLVACGNEDQAAGNGGTTISVSEPANDASVTLPFTLKVSSSVPLGPTDSGKHHVHVWFDDDSENYAVVESETVDIGQGLKALSGKTLQLGDGPHTIHVSLRNANHSAAGADTQVAVEVSGAGATESPAASTTTDDGDGY